MVRTRKGIYIGNQEVQRRYIGNKLIFEILGDMDDKIKLSGVVIFTDKADDSVVHVEMDGKSYQHAGSGKNLFYSIYSHHSNAGYNSSQWTSAIAKIEPNKTYTVSYTVTDSNRFGLWQDTLSNGIKADRIDKSSSPYRQTTRGEEIKETITTNEDGGYLVIYLSSNKNDVRERIQIEEGSTATEYEPPAPNPDYPIEIHSLNDFDVVSSTEKLSEGQLEEYNHDTEYENVYKINLLLSEPLRSVGDVKDRLFRDSDGLWKVERNVEVTGTEDGTQSITDAYSPYDVPVTEVLSVEYQNKLSNLRSFQDSNYVYTVINNVLPTIAENLKPTLHATFKSKGWCDHYQNTLLK